MAPIHEPGATRAGGALRISVIIPALNEDEVIGRALSSAGGAACERIVVDGGSGDETVARARAVGARVLRSGRGRARQMNTGAEAATGDVLLFLHADTSLPGAWAETVRRTLETGAIAGAFRFRTDGRGMLFRWIEGMVNWRSRWRRLPYGDQAIFVRREVFEAMGGFPELPVMEDFAFVAALRRRGRVELADRAVVTSARRWYRHGLVRTTLLNQACVLAYWCGVSPQRIARWR